MELRVGPSRLAEAPLIGLDPHHLAHLLDSNDAHGVVHAPPVTLNVVQLGHALITGTSGFNVPSIHLLAFEVRHLERLVQTTIDGVVGSLRKEQKLAAGGELLGLELPILLEHFAKVALAGRARNRLTKEVEPLGHELLLSRSRCLGLIMGHGVKGHPPQRPPNGSHYSRRGNHSGLYAALEHVAENMRGRLGVLGHTGLLERRAHLVVLHGLDLLANRATATLGALFRENADAMLADVLACRRRLRRVAHRLNLGRLLEDALGERLHRARLPGARSSCGQRRNRRVRWNRGRVAHLRNRHRSWHCKMDEMIYG